MDNGNNMAPGLAAGALGVIVLALGIGTVWTAGTTRGLQQTLAANQQKMAKAQAAATLDNNLVQMLAKAAIDGRDSALRDLLSANGVTLKQPPAAPAAAKPEATDAK